MKKIIAFDLDGTLAPTKSHFADQMVEVFDKLLAKYQVCVISGGKFELFERQFLTQITDKPELLKRLHLMPTSGTRYYRFEEGSWQQKYAETIAPADRKRIIEALEEGFNESGYRGSETYGDIVEDRGTQISLSTLGQDVVAHLGESGVRMKEEWDPDNSKKERLRELIAPKIPDFEVRAAGFTTIDVTKPGIDKAYGMKKLMEATGLSAEDILFVGDGLFPGGNDYAVKLAGIDCIAVRKWEDTVFVIEGLLYAAA